MLLNSLDNLGGFPMNIPIAFQDDALLSALAHPNHLLLVGSRGFTRLTPSLISKSNGYNILLRLLCRLLWAFILFFGITAFGADKQLTIGNGAEPISLDPHLFKGTTEAQILKDLFEGLVVYEQGKIKPGNAHWEVLDNGLRYRFHLKPDLQWSDGSALGAEDYVYSFRRAIDPQTGSDYSWYFRTATIKNSAEILEKSRPPESLGVTAIDKQTLDIELEKPVSYFLSLIDFPIFLPVPKQAIHKYGAEWTQAQKMISNGAYKLSRWNPGERVVINKSPYYHNQENIHIEQVTYLPVSDTNEEISLYLNNKIDISLGVPFARYNELKEKRPNELIDSPRLQINLLIFNVRTSSSHQVNIRKALAYSIDRDKLVKIDPSHHAEPTFLLTPAMVTGSRFNLPKYARWSQKQREKEALRLYHEAGFNEGNPLKIKLLSVNRRSTEQWVSVLSEHWKKVLGIEVEVELLDWSLYINRVFSGQFDVVLCPWLGAYDDTSAFMELMVSGFQSNFSGFNNDRYNQLVPQARVAGSMAERQLLYQQADDILQQEMPVIPLHTTGGLRMVSTKIKGFPKTETSRFFYSRQLDLVQP